MFKAGDGSKESYFSSGSRYGGAWHRKGLSSTEGKSESGKNMYVYSLKAEFMYNFVDGKWKDVYGFHNVRCQMKRLTTSSWLQTWFSKC